MCYVTLFVHLFLVGLMLQRIDDEDDEVVVNDQDVERLVIVTQVCQYDHNFI